MSRFRLRWVATCARGLEELLREELVSCGLEPTGSDPGGVGFEGDLEHGVRANWRLRTANRVLLELASWPAPDDEALYLGAIRLLSGTGLESDPPAAGELAPARLLDPDRTFAIAATASRSRLRDPSWIALRVKDGIVDGQRARFDRRSSIARRDPDLSLRLRLRDDRATLLLDSSGEPLDRRGYRVAVTGAPLREQLAAAAILASGWDGSGPVVDPMCGSGTLLAEAGALSAGLAPNRLRRSWAFERLPGFRPELFDRIRAEPLPATDRAAPLIGVDLDPQAVAAAVANLRAAGLSERSRIELGDAFARAPFGPAPPAGPGLVAVNPPYGGRVDASAGQWRRLGDLLKKGFPGWRAVVVAGDADLGKRIGLRPTRRLPFRNGPLEARILVFALW